MDRAVKVHRSRWVLLALAFSCFFIMSAQRSNISIAIVGMVDWDILDKYPCKPNHTGPADMPGRFQWGYMTQSQILAGYLYGLATAQAAATSLAISVSPKWLPFAGTLVASICSFFTPIAAHHGEYSMILIQFGKGLSHSLILPGFDGMANKWLLPENKRQFMGYATTGLAVGAFFTILTAGITVEYPPLGWETIFYYCGGLGVIWSLVWLYMICDYFFPTALIFETEPIKKKTMKVSLFPCRAILTSSSIWAYMVAVVATYWAYTLNFLLLPTILRRIYKVNIKENSYISSLTHLLQDFFYFASVVFNDRIIYIRSHPHFREKLCIIAGLCAFFGCCMVLTYTGCNKDTFSVTVILGFGLFGINLAAIETLPTVLTPTFAGLISCIANTVGPLAGSILLAMDGSFAEYEPHHNLEYWRKVLVTSVLLSVVAVVLFLGFGSCERQPWDSDRYTRHQPY